MNLAGSTFKFANGGTLSFKYSGSMLPIAVGSLGKEPSAAGYLGSSGHNNISKAQEELLLWHSILGHYDINNTQKLMSTVGVDKEPLISPKEPGAETCTIPLCTACLRGKWGLTPTYSKISSPDPDHADVIKENDLFPGDSVSTDQYECRIRGRLPNTRGKEDPQKMYCGGTLFSDHASAKIDVFHQVSLGASDTIRSKNEYETQAGEMGVRISSYRGDNGVYQSKEFKNNIINRQQTMSYSGVGVHGQNGVAERGISTVVNSARTMMLHQALLWPEQFDMRLWPFALTHAAYLWNVLPNGKNGLSPMEVFSCTKMDHNVLRSEKTWGCPAYVLDPKLQDGKKLPKWDPRTRQGQYLGRSTKHASSVGLIRNLNTGFISPQFHVLYDTRFQTVMGGYENNDAVANHIYDSLWVTERENVLVEAEKEQEP